MTQYETGRERTSRTAYTIGVPKTKVTLQVNLGTIFQFLDLYCEVCKKTRPHLIIRNGICNDHPDRESSRCYTCGHEVDLG